MDLDPSNVKAEMRRITSLAELEWTVEAQSFFEAFSHSKPKGSTDVQNIKAKMDNILKQRGRQLFTATDLILYKLLSVLHVK